MSRNKIARKKDIYHTELREKGFQPTNTDWTSVYNDLDSEIKLRHSSPRTWSAYRGWTRQFQGFTKSKDPKRGSVGSDQANILFLCLLI